MTSFADDSVIRYGNDLAVLIIEMEKSLEAITKWLKKSGLKVIESKTELCLFHRNKVYVAFVTLKKTITISRLKLMATPKSTPC